MKTVTGSLEKGRSRSGSLLAIVLTSVLSGTVSAAPAAQPEPWVSSAFAGDAVSTELLSTQDMEATRGKFAPLPFIAFVVGADIALMSFFWGTYVPSQRGGGGVGGAPCCQNGTKPR